MPFFSDIDRLFAIRQNGKRDGKNSRLRFPAPGGIMKSTKSRNVVLKVSKTVILLSAQGGVPVSTGMPIHGQRAAGRAASKTATYKLSNDNTELVAA